MKNYLLYLTLILLASSCFNPEIPTGKMDKKQNNKTESPNHSPSTGNVNYGIYKLTTEELVEFDQIQTFPYFKESKGSTITSDYIHVFRFNADESLDLEMMKKSNNQSFQSSYTPDGGWEKIILLDSKNKLYYKYTRKYSLQDKTIEAPSTASTLELIIKSGQIIGCKFNESVFYKSNIPNE